MSCPHKSLRTYPSVFTDDAHTRHTQQIRAQGNGGVSMDRWWGSDIISAPSTDISGTVTRSESPDSSQGPVIMTSKSNVHAQRSAPAPAGYTAVRVVEDAGMAGRDPRGDGRPKGGKLLQQAQHELEMSRAGQVRQQESGGIYVLAYTLARALSLSPCHSLPPVPLFSLSPPPPSQTPCLASALAVLK